MAKSKDLNALRKEYEKQGWTVERTRGGHLAWTSPDKNVRPIYSASTPSDRRALNNLRAALRRASQ